MHTIPKRELKDGRAFIRVVEFADIDDGTESFRANFHQQFPEGTRYDVLAWDGGCEDRATVQACFTTKKDASEFVKEYNRCRS